MACGNVRERAAGGGVVELAPEGELERALVLVGSEEERALRDGVREHALEDGTGERNFGGDVGEKKFTNLGIDLDW